MKKSILTVALCVFFSGSVLADNHGSMVADARDMVKQFFGSLKGELEKGMKTGGPVTAISVCNVKAPMIAEETGKDSGWQVARTSLRLRNPANKPDDWELRVLNYFEKRKAAGEDVTKMEYSKVVSMDGKQTFRYMKAIPTAKLCLNCHGTKLKPEVARSLDELYPEDQATGYKAGDIRGAFTLQKTL